MNMMRRGITLVDVVTTIVVLILLFSIAVPLLAQANDNNNRRQCAGNLRGIMQSMNVYGADNADQFPFIGGDSATTYDAVVKAAEGTPKADDTIDQLYKQEKITNNPFAPLWLLVLKNQV